MPESPGFIAFAVELLSRVGPVRARAMFGGHGLYCGTAMIGLVDDDEIFLKTDDATRARFEEAGCRQWVYAGGGREMRTSYFRPPDEAHESPEEMEPWGRLALEAGRRAAAARRARKASPRARKAARRARKGGAAGKGRAARVKRSEKKKLPPLPVMKARELVDVSDRKALHGAMEKGGDSRARRKPGEGSRTTRPRR